jgi:predicted glycogen debranching enzyme
MSSEPLILSGWRRGEPREALLTREWLVTNGLGGYASGTIAGACTRRFHGLLIAALPAPLGRVVLWNHLASRVTMGESPVLSLAGEESSRDEVMFPDISFLDEFWIEDGLPVWRFRQGGVTLEKRIVLPHLQNTSYIAYRLVSALAPIVLTLRPGFHFRAHEALLEGQKKEPYGVVEAPHRWQIEAPPGQGPGVRLQLFGQQVRMHHDEGSFRNLHYRIEHGRGYDSDGWLWTPGFLEFTMAPGEEVVVAASAEPWEAFSAHSPAEVFEAERERRRGLLSRARPELRRGLGAQLVLAADQFIIAPNTRREAARSEAAADDARTVIAGYHWFTDWGRDTMISLPGLALLTGRSREAGAILRTFAGYVKDGLIPNMFPEGEHQGLYHTADATLWFFHAVHRYLEATNDRGMLERLLPKLVEIVDRHVEGTRFGIGVDPEDGLLRQGAQDYQLTWMDAKVDGWVVTPRRGKAVEINALFYNALCLLAGWMPEAASRKYRELAGRVRSSFQRRFWYAEGGYLFDVVDGEQGDDRSLRPNQIFAIAMPHPVLDESRWAPVLEAVRARLLTPVGLRSLAPGHRDYKATYDGDLRSRDAAYHQGTVWGWLIGPFIDAWLKVHPEDRAGARKALAGFGPHLREACVGSISEIFDAEEPFTPRGCVAQAWSVAEVLRCLSLTAEGGETSP